MAHSAGDSVSALIAERNIATATVTANWRNSSPEMPGMKATGTNTDSSTSVMAMIGAVISRIACLVASAGRELRMLLHHALDVLDHHDGVVDHDADRQHDGEQRHRVGRIADGVEHDEGADQAHRHGDGRDQGGAQAAEEQEHHEHHEHEGLDQRLLHLVDGGRDEGGRIVGDLPGEILGEALLAARRAASRTAASVDERVGAGRLVDGDRRRRAAVEAGVAVEIGGAELDAARRRAAAAPSRRDWCG